MGLASETVNQTAPTLLPPAPQASYPSISQSSRKWLIKWITRQPNNRGERPVLFMGNLQTKTGHASLRSVPLNPCPVSPPVTAPEPVTIDGTLSPARGGRPDSTRGYGVLFAVLERTPGTCY